MVLICWLPYGSLQAFAEICQQLMLQYYSLITALLPQNILHVFVWIILGPGYHHDEKLRFGSLEYDDEPEEIEKPLVKAKPLFRQSSADDDRPITPLKDLTVYNMMHNSLDFPEGWLFSLKDLYFLLCMQITKYS